MEKSNKNMRKVKSRIRDTDGEGEDKNYKITEGKMNQVIKNMYVPNNLTLTVLL